MSPLIEANLEAIGRLCRLCGARKLELFGSINISRAALLDVGVAEGELPRIHRGISEAFRQGAVPTGKVDAELLHLPSCFALFGLLLEASRLQIRHYADGRMTFMPAARANCCWRTSKVAKCLYSSSKALASDVQDVQGPAADRAGVFATELGGSFQGGSPQYISLSIAPLSKVVVEGGQCRVMDFVGDDPAVSGESNAVGQLDPAMMSHEKRVADFFPPLGHCA
jgi:hypothetical protein